MTEKLTPEEIKKALECCGDTDDGCLHCPLYGSPAPECGMRLCRESLELHNSQQVAFENSVEATKHWHREAELNAKEIIRLQAEIDELKRERDTMLEDLQFRSNQVIEQQAEIERLQNEVIAKEYEYNDMLEQRNSVEYNLELLKQEKSVVVAEAVKEFAEKLKDVFTTIDGTFECCEVEEYIDILVKEMVGEQG